MCKAGRNEGGSYTYLRPNRAYFPEYGSADLGGISVGLGARYQSRKKSTLWMWAICQTIVIFRNTEEQMLDRYKSKYYPIWTSVSDITFTRCFFGVIMNQPMKLSLEQQFSICSFSTQVQSMSHEQAKDFLVKLYEQMVVREATYQELLKHQWGLDSGSTMA